MASITGTRSDRWAVIEIEGEPQRPQEVVNIIVNQDMVLPHEQNEGARRRHPISVAVTAGIIGIAALPIIATAATAVAIPTVAFLGARLGIAHMRNNQERADATKANLCRLLKIALPAIALGFMPGSSVVMAGLYIISMEHPRNN